ncbi:MAG: hypothetical protein A2077_07240 [Nitrospirae bacterium GWC2_46_6]|nr:MAG: hypothetical protein A2077_07240 [Nitrospirae bacterium GWC2_46_6]OGW22272.1 MAG: hypothetical protein A2Z82_10115 [Nitrospirae bacterium GWA2_46_11]OGW23195.1 MAG: hypothetical protein A2X55_09490 [Nitrospirae bacterium GWB2_47_37]HAK87745.1 hypothetical protein [Nitrospiraceae bacterium]HCZ11437.1 hypothetical protein [Nitrospiraceae bacterium]
MNINGEVELLTFNIGGVKMGVDTAQIAAMLETGQAEERGVSVSGLFEKMPFRGREITCSAPHVIVIKDEGDPYGILIDRPDDILRVSIDDIRHLPPIFAACGCSKAIWGAVLKGEDVILLVDFYRPAEN